MLLLTWLTSLVYLLGLFHHIKHYPRYEIMLCLELKALHNWCTLKMFQVIGSDKATQKQMWREVRTKFFHLGEAPKILRILAQGRYLFSQKKIWKTSDLDWICLHLSKIHMYQCFTSSNLSLHTLKVNVCFWLKCFLSVLVYSFCQQQPQ